MSTSQKGTISVHTENLFPIIKKFLYHDHDIFIRELVSNAVDASQKLKVLASKGEFTGELGDLKIKITLDEEAKTLTISDSGVGMTADEINKYINQIAFSGAEEFVQKYQETQDANIIGHFGLGFYSSFMVAKTVEINTLSHLPESVSAKWVCDGSTSFEISEGSRTERGTDIILYLAEDQIEEFGSKWKIKTLLEKYCKFLPIEIEFDGQIINNTNPIWKKSPTELKDEDYTAFFKELFPFQEAPLFWIHINVDYPFNLTGILYFPKFKREVEPVKDRLKLFSNQVFVTDKVEEIVPDFLMLLQGVIDSPDIPLNVSRSSLQSDSNVKKITSHISKKVADKLQELYKKDRADYESKWSSINIFAKYGMISDEKFAEKAKNFILLENTEHQLKSIDEYMVELGINQVDKDGNTVMIYSNDTEKQHGFILAAKQKGYDVIILNEMIDSHFIMNLEQKNEKLKLKRVDSTSADLLIDKDEKLESTLSEDQINQIETLFKTELNTDTYTIQSKALSPNDTFVAIVQDEFDRRMREMSQTGGGMYSFMGSLPEKFNVIINTNHPLINSIANDNNDDSKKSKTKNAIDLAMLSQNMLKGQALTDFVNRCSEMMK